MACFFYQSVGITDKQQKHISVRQLTACEADYRVDVEYGLVSRL